MNRFLTVATILMSMGCSKFSGLNSMQAWAEDEASQKAETNENKNSSKVIDFSRPQKYILRYSVTLPQAVKKKQKFNLWSPYPTQDFAQEVYNVAVNTKRPWEINVEKKNFNKMIYVSGQLEDQPDEIRWRFEVLRKPITPEILPKKLKKDMSADELKYLKTNLKANILIPLNKRIEDEVKIAARGAKTEQEKIRNFYEHAANQVIFSDKAPGVGNGDAIFACDSKTGDCTDIHALFIALSRKEGYPANAIMGIPIPPSLTKKRIPGHHCWAEVFDSKIGWMPVDASEAQIFKDLDRHFGQIPSNRVQLGKGRDVILNPPQKGKPLNFFSRPYLEIDGKPVENLEWKLIVEHIENDQ